MEKPNFIILIISISLLADHIQNSEALTSCLVGTDGVGSGLIATPCSMSYCKLVYSVSSSYIGSCSSSCYADELTSCCTTDNCNITPKGASRVISCYGQGFTTTVSSSSTLSIACLFPNNIFCVTRSSGTTIYKYCARTCIASTDSSGYTYDCCLTDNCNIPTTVSSCRIGTGITTASLTATGCSDPSSKYCVLSYSSVTSSYTGSCSSTCSASQSTSCCRTNNCNTIPTGTVSSCFTGESSISNCISPNNVYCVTQTSGSNSYKFCASTCAASTDSSGYTSSCCQTNNCNNQTTTTISPTVTTNSPITTSNTNKNFSTRINLNKLFSLVFVIIGSIGFQHIIN